MSAETVQAGKLSIQIPTGFFIDGEFRKAKQGVTGRNGLRAAANSNLKKVTLELGGKSPNIIFEDADLEQAVGWAVNLPRGSTYLWQEKVYDEFIKLYKENVQAIQVGDNFDSENEQGPKNSKIQYDKILGYITKGKKEGATVVLVIELADDTKYGIAAGIRTKKYEGGVRVTGALKGGTTGVNMFILKINDKESGLCRECGGAALDNYTEIKTVYLDIGMAPVPIGQT
ncbi:Aldehyde dehydrogenase [Venturia nashicola]|nr:Aldehyde dehydrogenase [Venturia nashicola]